MSGLVNRALAYVGVLLLGVTSVAAQDAAEPQAVAERQVWTAEASAGFSLISGNKETSTLNIAFDASYSPDARHTIKSNGLMIRGKTDGELSADRLGLNVRDEYQLNGRAFVFGQHRYLSDEVKDIAYLFAPTGGFGYRLVDTSATEVSLDAGIGGVWEKNANSVTRSSGAVTVGEEVSHALTETTTLTQTFSGLWKTRDLSDSLFEVGASVAAAISTRTQLKVEVLNTFKNRPSAAAVQKNDVAVLVALAYTI